MAAPTTILAMVGFRNCRVYALNAAGVPAAPDANPYEGIRLSGAEALTITHPQPRDILHFGDDFVFARDILPPTSAMDAVIKAGKRRNDLDAVLSGVLSYTAGEAKGLNVATNAQGFEPQFGILAYAQAVDANEDGSTMGKRLWGSVQYPKAWVIFQEQPMDQNPYKAQYTVRAAFVTTHLWGLPYTTSLEGSLTAQEERWATEFKPDVVAWKSANSSPTKFLFATARPAEAVAKVHVVTRYIASSGAVSDITGTATIAVDGITPATIATNDIVTAYYEYA